ncbi:hypothetical protein CVU37_11645 [candidate division BRC1 bacterium HGW-BRC1-1]|nr:MAG: hypothetical protein CVU37_11645 [candidate division BRC1 bacterium HGW-BRC1-1]
MELTLKPFYLILLALLAGTSPSPAADPFEVDVLIVGGGTGSVPAALAATRNGRSVVILEETPWIGGQLTSQGLSCPDEHGQIETVSTSSYSAYRRLVRDYYTLGYRLSEAGRDQKFFNPGDAWVSRLAHEPRAALAAINQLLRPATDAGTLRVYTNTVVTRVTASAGVVSEVTAERVIATDPLTKELLVIRPRYVIEATLLGDFLEMAGVPFSVGLESQAQTGEPHAYPGEPDPRGVQGFTQCFAVEFRPGESHVIAKPAMYESFLKQKRYSLNGFPFFSVPGAKNPPFWTYRRMISTALFDDARLPNDVVVMNWGSNDYHDRDLIGATPAERLEILDEAKQLSLGFLYWLQTECPRDEGGKGYPELMLRPDVMGTTDGVAMMPYIRESRRIKARTTVVEQDLHNTSPLVRARLFDDSVGIGEYYVIDLHQIVGEPRPLTVRPKGAFTAKPFQIPLGALIPAGGGNVLAGQKNLGVTHVANGAYRMHPTEWNTGEAAGTLAAFCLENSVTPTEVHQSKPLTRQLQKRLVKQGVPIFWYADLNPATPEFAGAQMLAMEQGPINPKSISFSAGAKLTPADRNLLGPQAKDLPTTATRRDAAKKFEEMGGVK